MRKMKGKHTDINLTVQEEHHFDKNKSPVNLTYSLITKKWFFYSINPLCVIHFFVVFLLKIFDRSGVFTIKLDVVMRISKNKYFLLFFCLILCVYSINRLPMES